MSHDTTALYVCNVLYLDKRRYGNTLFPVSLFPCIHIYITLHLSSSHYPVEPAEERNRRKRQISVDWLGTCVLGDEDGLGLIA